MYYLALEMKFFTAAYWMIHVLSVAANNLVSIFNAIHNRVMNVAARAEIFLSKR